MITNSNDHQIHLPRKTKYLTSAENIQLKILISEGGRIHGMVVCHIDCRVVVYDSTIAGEVEAAGGWYGYFCEVEG